MAISISRTRCVFCVAGFVGLACIVVGLLAWWKFAPPGPESEKSFAGSSDDLRQTVGVPTLETSFPAGKSAIWCSSFQLAWNRLRTDIVHGPPQTKDAERVVELLNQAKQSEEDLPPDAYYAAAGRIDEGILEKIRGEMANKFPDGPALDLTADPGLVGFAYAYLNAGAKYEHPYHECTKPFAFMDSEGRSTRVEAFGILQNTQESQASLREQLEILFVNHERDEDGRFEFAVDLCKDSSPNQIVLARLPRKATLAETISELNEKMAQPVPQEISKRFRTFGTFLAPKMNWRVEHHFKELEGSDKPFLNPVVRGLYVSGALQTISFRMDRDGAAVVSEAKLSVKSATLAFDFNQPFLIYLTKRDAAYPFFVMWVDNAELLCKRP